MIKINVTPCIGCGRCAMDCVTNEIEIIEGKATVKNINCLKCGHCIAVCPTNAVSIDDYEMSEVLTYDKNTFDIESDRLLNFIKFRRSIRHFNNIPVEEDKIRKIIEAGRFTATGSNSQNVSYLVVRDKIAELRTMALKTLSETAKGALTKHSSPAAIYFSEKFTNMYESDQKQPGKNDKLFYNAPLVLLIVSDSPVNAALAASNMELMAVTLGLGGFYCGFFTRAANSSPKIANMLELKEHQKVEVCLALGYPNLTYFRTVPRKQADIRWF